MTIANHHNSLPLSKPTRDWMLLIPRTFLDTVSADAILEMDFPPLIHPVPGLVTDGLTLLAGLPKEGKSRLASALAMAVAKGTEFLGRPVGRTGEVLYLALEESARLIKPRLQEFGAKGDRTLGKLKFNFRLKMSAEQALHEIEQWLKSTPGAAMVVIDVLAIFRAAGARQAINYARDYELMTEFKRLSQGVFMLANQPTRQ